MAKEASTHLSEEKYFSEEIPRVNREVGLVYETLTSRRNFAVTSARLIQVAAFHVSVFPTSAATTPRLIAAIRDRSTRPRFATIL